MTPPQDRDRTAELLARALHEEAAMTGTDPQALHEIQRRTRPSGASRRSWLYAGLGAAAATAAVIAVVAVAGNQSNPSPGPGHAGLPITTSETLPQGMHDGVYDPAAPDAEQISMSYFDPRQFDSHGIPRLYTEPHTVGVHTGDPELAAIHEFLTSTPMDPDYTSGWPEGVDVDDVRYDGDMAVVALTGDADLGDFPSQALCLPHTESAVQALLRSSGIAVPTTFTYNGGPVSWLFRCVDVSDGVTLTSDDMARALITVDNLQEGQAVANPVTVLVSGNVFEGSVNWQLLDDSGGKVDEGFVTTSMGTWTQASIELGDLAPGTYTIRCLEYSPEDGSPGNVDDKTFVVR